MNLDLSPGEREFRDAVRGFLANAVTDSLRRRVRAQTRLEPEEYTAWQRRLAAVGWGAPTWPRDYGGTGWTPLQHYIFETEATAADAPLQFHQGLELIGPIIFTYGTTAQKTRYLPGIVSGDHWWAQGYSEPGAGSDLAALSTSAVRDGEHYVVVGQKLWTSYAHVATHMFCLVRTAASARKQDGISLLLIDLPAPGLRIRPILTLDERHHVNEVFFDAVRVPAANLIGEEGKGWSYGKVLLDRERGVAAAMAQRLAQSVRSVRRQAAATRAGRQRLIDTPIFRDKLAQIEIELLALDCMILRTAADAASGIDAGPRASMLKLRWSELLQRLTELRVEASGYDATRFAALDGALPDGIADPMLSYLHGRVTTIYGGSSEIQRNIIARRALGL